MNFGYSDPVGSLLKPVVGNVIKQAVSPASPIVGKIRMRFL